MIIFFLFLSRFHFSAIFLMHYLLLNSSDLFTGESFLQPKNEKFLKLNWDENEHWKQSKKMQIFFAVIWFPQTVRFVTFMWSTIITTTFSLINHKAVITGFVRDFHSYSDDDEEHSKTLCHIMTNHLRMIRLHR